MAGIDGFGTLLKRGDGGTPQVYTAIANPTSITPPGLDRDTYDTTTHGTPNRYRTFIGGLVDGGETSADINYEPAEHDSLMDDFEDAQPRSWQIVFPDDLGTTWTFDAILTGFEPDAPHDDLLTATITLKVSGKPVLS
jgi:predicted secreted protein